MEKCGTPYHIVCCVNPSLKEHMCNVILTHFLTSFFYLSELFLCNICVLLNCISPVLNELNIPSHQLQMTDIFIVGLLFFLLKDPFTSRSIYFKHAPEKDTSFQYNCHIWCNFIIVKSLFNKIVPPDVNITLIKDVNM